MPLESDDLLHCFARNQGTLDAITAEALDGRVEGHDGVALADTVTPLAYWNQATLLRPLTGIDDPTLDAIDAFWSDTSRPRTLLSMWPTPDLASRGWALMGHPMLVVRAPGSHDSVASTGVVIRDVTSPADLAIAEQTVIDGYPLPGWTSPVGTLLRPSLLDTAMKFRLGELDGRVVGATRGYVGDGVVNLAMAATLPAARRRGVWAAMVWARVDDAADLPAIAYTSDDSRPGFLAMGFLPVTRTTLWFRA